ncbi:MAG: substrate-binding domain-containing protein [Chloroflexota bacterium]|mgnify:CR=1 FL=1
MRFLPRWAVVFAALALTLPSLSLLAQNETTTVAGSGVVAPLVQALIDSNEIAGVEVNVTGTNSGFTQLCDGDVDVTLATRPINSTEEANCIANGVEFVELLLGHNIIAFVTSAEAETPQCVTLSELTTALAPSAQNQISNWNQLNPAYPDIALTVAGPAIDTPAYGVADAAIEGVGLRSDISVQASDEETLAAVAENPGTLGIVYLASIQAADNVRALEIDSGDGTGCAAPTAENVENRLYPAADRLFAYANINALDKPGAAALFEALTAESAAGVVEAAGFTPATGNASTRNAAIVADRTTGRQFSREVVEYSLPEQIFGGLTLGGSPIAATYIQTLSNTFTGSYPSVAIDSTFLGTANGITRMCAGELDILVSNAELTDEQLAECEANNITLERLDMGRKNAVLVANAESDYLACLTTDEIATIWRAQSAEDITTWNQVNAEFPEAEMFLFAPASGANGTSDLLMIATTGVATPIRVDVTETNSDPLYRAAATANVEGALTYMHWAEYQRVLDNNQANIQLVSVDAGDGCIEPSLATIEDGSYPISEPFYLYVKQSSLVRPETQGFLWTALSDANYTALTNAGFVGLEFGELPDTRTALQQLFAEAEANAAVQAEVTPEPETAEATPEATEEAGE